MATAQKRLEKAHALVARGAWPRARPLLRALVREAPDHPLPWNLLGIVETETGHFEPAIGRFRKAIALAPGDADFHANLGEALRRSGQAEAALPSLHRALAVNPRHAGAHNNAGAALLALHRPREAAQHLLHAVRLKPNNAEAFANLGLALVAQRQAGEAVPCFREACRVDPEQPLLEWHLIQALAQSGALEPALTLSREAQARHPDQQGFALQEIRVLDRLGRIDDAVAKLRPLVGGRNHGPGVALAFAAVARHMNRESDALEAVSGALEATQEPRALIQALWFEKARLADRLGAFDTAFAALQRANRLNERPYRHDAAVAYFEAWRALPKSGLPRANNRSEVPVFIVGMPRSGTSLVERILDRHPEIHGAGELTAIRDLGRHLTANPIEPDPAALAALPANRLDAAADAHLRALDALSGGARRVVDKMPHNFRHLGLAAMLFPGARVIHCRRDGRDTCLSCYSQNFYAGHAYSYDLADLGRHYRLYQDFMAHWRDTLALPILDLDYEALIADPVTESRRLIDFLGLDWHDACLDADLPQRPALTASYDQVRRPIYSDSVGRHRHYAAHLAALVEALQSGS